MLAYTLLGVYMLVMDRNRERVERASRVINAEQQKQQERLGQLSTQHVQREEALRQRSIDTPRLVIATHETLAALDAAGFPGVQTATVHRPKFRGHKISKEPGWNLVNQPNDYVEDKGGSGMQVWLLAEGNYYVEISRTGSSGRATSYDYCLLSPQEYGNKYGIDILPKLQELGAATGRTR